MNQEIKTRHTEVSKQEMEKFDMERYNLKELDKMEGKEWHPVKISYSFER
jgi:hypothetical protein